MAFVAAVGCSIFVRIVWRALMLGWLSHTGQSQASHLITRVPTRAAATTPEFAFAQNMTNFPPAHHDLLGLGDLLTADEQRLRLRVREMAERDVAPVITGYWERAEFPFVLLPKIKELAIGGGHLKGYGCQGHSVMACAMACVELVGFQRVFVWALINF